MTVGFAPAWFVAAKASGCSKEVLLEKLRAHCLEVLQQDARKKGAPIPDHVEDGVVRLTFDMYEGLYG